MELKTPLYAEHLALGGKMVPFAGYLLPVQYPTGVIAEHMAVRERAGLFDVSHMGEITFTGADALANLNRLMTNDFTGMYDGQVRYSPMCTETGGVIDDLLVYRMGAERYLVVVNASNRAKDAQWMREHLSGAVELSDISETVAQVALQGPRAGEILARLCDAADIPQKYYSFVEQAQVRLPSGIVRCLISKTGYTGEDGYELYCDTADAPALWSTLLATGADCGLIACGLGARDTLRLEASMPLYGHEMDDTVTPQETGLGFAVKMQKPDFIGKAAMEAKLPPARTRIGLRMTGRGIAREQCAVFKGDKQIGFTTSGTHCPYLNGAYAMAMVEAGTVAIGDTVEADVRGRRIAAEVVPLPFYKRK